MPFPSTLTFQHPAREASLLTTLAPMSGLVDAMTSVMTSCAMASVTLPKWIMIHIMDIPVAFDDLQDPSKAVR